MTDSSSKVTITGIDLKTSEEKNKQTELAHGSAKDTGTAINKEIEPAKAATESSDTEQPKKKVIRYFENDFDWDDVAKERRTQCEGELAPALLDKSEVKDYLDNATNVWEGFYQRHKNAFFKLRSYLVMEFPVLRKACESALPGENVRIIEAGCGTGSALLPLLRNLPNLVIAGADVSAKAVELMRQSPELSEVGNPHRVWVCDLGQEDLVATGEASQLAIGEQQALGQSFDFGLLVFTLCAFSADQHDSVIQNLKQALKPGAHVLFRDYGLFDMVQVRCKQRLGENFYIKSDGVQCYFFSTEYLSEIFERNGFKVLEAKYCTVRNINRKTGAKLDRVFIHGLFKLE